MVLLTTGPTGGETEELQKTLDDGRDVRFRFNRDERAGDLTITGPSGDEFRFTLLQTAGNGLVFTDGAISANGGQERTLNRRELAAVIDAAAPAFAEAGVRIEIGGDDAGQGGDDRDLSRDDNNPPERVEDTENNGGDQSPEPERHFNIVAAGGVAATMLMNRENFNKDYLVEDTAEVSQEIAEQMLGTSPESFDVEALKQALDAHVPDARARLEEIQAARDVFNPSSQEIAGAEGLGGFQFENFIRKTYGGKRGFRARHRGVSRQIDGELPDGTWYEAKGGKFWEELLNDPRILTKFHNQLRNQKLIAKGSRRNHVLITNGNIPRSIRLWLKQNGIKFIELTKVK